MCWKTDWNLKPRYGSAARSRSWLHNFPPSTFRGFSDTTPSMSGIEWYSRNADRQRYGVGIAINWQWRSDWKYSADSGVTWSCFRGSRGQSVSVPKRYSGDCEERTVDLGWAVALWPYAFSGQSIYELWNDSTKWRPYHGYIQSPLPLP